MILNSIEFWFREILFNQQYGVVKSKSEKIDVRTLQQTSMKPSTWQITKFFRLSLENMRFQETYELIFIIPKRKKITSQDYGFHLQGVQAIV